MALRSRPELGENEIKRITDFFYASTLEEDDMVRSEDDSDRLYRSVYEQLDEAGGHSRAGHSKGALPAFGMSDRQMQKRGETLAIVSAAAKDALARNDIGFVADEVAGLLEDFRIDLDVSSVAFRRLGNRHTSGPTQLCRAVSM